MAGADKIRISRARQFVLAYLLARQVPSKQAPFGAFCFCVCHSVDHYRVDDRRLASADFPVQSADPYAASAALRAAGVSLKYERQVCGSQLELHFGSTRPSTASDAISGKASSRLKADAKNAKREPQPPFLYAPARIQATFCFLRIAPSPIRPSPSSTRDAGSGTELPFPEP